MGIWQHKSRQGKLTLGEMGDLEKGMGPVEANHIFLNVPMTRSTPGKGN